MVIVTMFCVLLVAVRALASDSANTAAKAINAFGIDLLHKAGKPDANALLSPYSIQSALAMAYAGADGVTREEMARALHYPKDEAEVHRSFAGLRKTLEEVVQKSAEYAQQTRGFGATNDAITLTIANRLFGQSGYDFRPEFLSWVKDTYEAPFQPLNFVKNPTAATQRINDWVENQTRQRIPRRNSRRHTRRFDEAGGRELPYSNGDGCTTLKLPYSGHQLQFLILLPDKVNGLAALEAKLTPDVLAGRAKWEERDVTLYLPKFKLEPPVLPLGSVLQTLGMKSAFDTPAGSANFDRIAPRRPDDYLKISGVFHKTFFNLDEKGTEAAAATAIHFNTFGIHERKKPVEVRVDHPFLFAILHQPSGACLFLGRMVDPR